MKRVGILTWYFGINYGARAHSLALKNVVEGFGYECEFINYTSCNSWKIELRTCCPTRNLKKHPIVFAKGVYKWLKFRKQLQDYKHSRRVRTASEIESLGYDTVIIGSDEILNLNHSLSNDIYYGVGFQQDAPLLMYAVSAGTVDPDTVLSNEIRKSLASIQNISVRDNTSQILLQNNSKKTIPIVLDPTLLYEFKSMSKRKENAKYILIYSFGTLDEYRESIVKYARKNSLKILCVGRECNWADRSLNSADLNEWINLYSYANCVVTDSYHGLIFAVKYHKEFILISRGDKTNKIDGLRTILNINRSYYDLNLDIEQYLSEKINYDLIDSSIAKERAASISYLENALKSAVEEVR